MEYNEQTYYLFNNYLNGVLSEKDKEAFQLKLESDSQFKSDFESFQVEQTLVIQHELIEAQEFLEKFEYTKPPISKKVIGSSIGALLLLISASTFLLLNPSAPSTKSTKKTVLVNQGNLKIEQPIPSVENTPPSVKKISALNNKGKSENPLVKVIEKTNEKIDSTITITPIDTTIIYQSKENRPPTQSIPDPVIIKKEDCNKINWEVVTTSEPTCAEKSEGTVSVKTQVSNVNIHFNDEVISQSSHTFTFLPPDIYTLKIVDSEGCVFNKKIEVKEKECKPIHLIIDPSTESYWTIPSEKEVLLTIRDKSGNIVFEQVIQPGYTYLGEDNYNTSLARGVYFYELKNDTTILGTITIP